MMPIIDPADTQKSIEFQAPHTSLTFNQNNQLIEGGSQLLRGFEVKSIESSGTTETTLVLGPGAFVSNGILVDVLVDTTIVAAVSYPPAVSVAVYGTTDSSMGETDTTVDIVTYGAIPTDAAILHVIREDGSIVRELDEGIRESKWGIVGTAASNSSTAGTPLAVNFSSLQFTEDDSELVFQNGLKLVKGTGYTITNQDSLSVASVAIGDQLNAFIMRGIKFQEAFTAGAAQTVFTFTEGSIDSSRRPLVFRDGLFESLDEFDWSSADLTLDNPATGGEIIEVVVVPAIAWSEKQSITDPTVTLAGGKMDLGKNARIAFLNGLQLVDFTNNSNQIEYRSQNLVTVDSSLVGTSGLFELIEFNPNASSSRAPHALRRPVQMDALQANDINVSVGTYGQEPEGTIDTIIFPASASGSVRSKMHLGEDFSGSIAILVSYIMVGAGAAGNVKLDMEWGALDHSLDLDFGTEDPFVQGDSDSIVFTPEASEKQFEVSYLSNAFNAPEVVSGGISFSVRGVVSTEDSLFAGTTVPFIFRRDGSDASDTDLRDLHIVSLSLFYAEGNNFGNPRR
jgi:hypothetical protein